MASSYLALLSIVLFLIAVFGWGEEVTGQCLEYQKSLLLNLDQNLTGHVYYNDNPIVFSEWDYNKDCCGWPGVTCNNNGHVVGLDLSDTRIALNNSSPLFHLQHLTTLNLAGNEFHFSKDTSSGFERLVNLMNLDLSYVNILGRFPIEISNLTRLVSLDLSLSRYEGDVNCEGLIGNLTKLTLLHLDGEYLRINHEWSKFMSSSLPHLRDLKLENFDLSRPIDNSFQNLTFLSILDLSANYFGTPIPTILSKLTSLNLADSYLHGDIPSYLTQLTTLTFLDLSYNQLSGLIPSFSRTINLKHLALGNNQLTGSMLNTNWGDLSRLEYVGVQFNFLNGSIPSSLFGIPTLLGLDVSSNCFTNFADEPVSVDSSQLNGLYLANNALNGPFPSFIYSLQTLLFLDLEFNNFSGTFCMDRFQDLRTIIGLVISYNDLVVDFGEELLELPRLKFLGMASCKLKVFPYFLKSNSTIIYLDLSTNHIQGEVPNWIWTGLRNVVYLNFSHNHLQTFEARADDTPSCTASIIDLSYNNLNGKISILLPQNGHLILSHNCFNSTVFKTLHTSSLSRLYISNNYLEGAIPKFFCNTSLFALDMSSNLLSGTLPACLLRMKDLLHLNLKNNTICGTIPDTVPLNCILYTVNLNTNSLEGTIPKSLGNCEQLRLLDLGNNKLHDRFPCWMSNNYELGVLVLKSNKLQGSIVCPGGNMDWPMLHIIDLSSNNFSGNLPSRQFLSWKAMFTNNPDSYYDHPSAIYFYRYLIDDDILLPPKFKTLKVEVSVGYYGTTLVLKGTNIAVPKIFSSFKMIDLSENKFEGTIPDELGYFNALHQLNISYNKLEGQIPSSLGRIDSFESLDLQNNELSGNIPSQLANLNFLSTLNLSFNKLEGKIPNGGQFQTFSEYSFLHNEGLCGLPLKISCDKKTVSTKLSKQSSFLHNGEVLISAEVGYAVGLGFIIMPLIFWTGWRRRFYEFTDRMILKIDQCIRVQRNEEA